MPARSPRSLGCDQTVGSYSLATAGHTAVAGAVVLDASNVMARTTREARSRVVTHRPGLGYIALDPRPDP